MKYSKSFFSIFKLSTVSLVFLLIASACGEQNTAQLNPVQQVSFALATPFPTAQQVLITPTATVKAVSSTPLPTIESQVIESPIILGTPRLTPTPRPAPVMPAIASITNKSAGKTISTVFSLTNGAILTIITPTIAVGEVISLPVRTAGAKMRKSATLPQMSYIEALDLVATINLVWPYGGYTSEGPIKITMMYGIGTDGQTGNTSGLESYVASSGFQFKEECKGWTGPCPVEIQRCANGACVSTGQVINRIENRPMWIVEYSNLPKGSVLKGGPDIKQPCGSAGLPACITTSRVAYKIDEQTKSVLSGIEQN